MKDNGPLDRREELDEILASCLDRLNSGEGLDPMEILARYPEMGNEILQELQAFLDLGGGTEDLEQPLGTLGDYTLRRQIGRGGMGVVYEAWENSMNRRVALKVLPAGVAADGRTFTRFLREAQVAGNLHHSNVVPVYGMGVREKTPYFAMEYVEGETLSQILGRLKAGAKEEPETPFGKEKEGLVYYGKIATAFAEVADGLQHAHSKGVIHRDIKPSNLILDGEGKLRILDFGLARLEGQESLTVSGEFFGTPLYMSPEQAMAKRIPIDHRTDVYSLGATLYEMLARRPPFQGKNQQDTLSKIIFSDPEAPRASNPGIPRDLETIVLKCLRKNPGDRYGTAEAMAQDLRRFVRGDPIEARPQSTFELWGKKVWRRRWALAALLGMLVVVFSVALLVQKHLTDHRREEWRKQEDIILRSVLGLELAQLTRTESGGSLDPGGLIARQGLEGFLLDASRSRIEEILGDLDKASVIIPDARYHYARALILLDRRDEALRELDEIGRDRRGFPAAWALREAVDRRMDLGRSPDPVPGPEPLNLLNRTEELGHLWYQFHDARFKKEWGQVAEAASRLSELEGAPSQSHVGANIEILASWALAQIQTGSFSEAIKKLSVLEYQQTDALEPALLLGKAWYLLERKEDAEQTFQWAFKQAEDRDQAAIWIIVVYHSLEDWEMAEKWSTAIETLDLRHLLRVQALADLGRYDEALAEARRGITLFPGDPRFHLCLGMALDLKEEAELALESYRKAHDLSEDDRRTLVTLGGALCFRRKIQEGFKYLYRAKELYPRSLDVLITLGGELYRYQKTEEAVEILNEAVTIAPDSWKAHSILGLCHSSLGEFQEAISHQQKAVALNPANPRTHWRLGATYFRRDESEKALQAYEEALRRIETSSRASGFQFLKSSIYCYHGGALKSLGRNQEAEDSFQAAVELCPKTKSSYIELAGSFKSIHQLKRAIDLYEKAIEMDGESAFAHSVLGLCLLVFGRIDEGFEEVKKAVDLAPREWRYQFNLSWGYFLKEEYENSVASFEETIRLLEGELEGSRTSFQLARLHSYLAQPLAALGKGEEVRGAIQWSLEFTPKTARAYTELGRILTEGELHAEARDMFRRAQECDPEYSGSYLRLGASYKKEGDIQRAFHAYTDALSRSGRNRVARESLTALLGEADGNLSREDLEKLHDVLGPILESGKSDESDELDEGLADLMKALVEALRKAEEELRRE